MNAFRLVGCVSVWAVHESRARLIMSPFIKLYRVIDNRSVSRTHGCFLVDPIGACLWRRTQNPRHHNGTTLNHPLSPSVLHRFEAECPRQRAHVIAVPVLVQVAPWRARPRQSASVVWDWRLVPKAK